MNTADPYQKLMTHLEYPESKRLRALLKNMMTAEQAAIVALLPGTVDEVAEKAGKDREEVQQVLDTLFFDGVVLPRGDFITRDYFKFARSIEQLHDASQASQMRDPEKDKDFYRLWHDFVMNEWYPDKGTRSAAAERPRSRIVPAYRSVKDNPDLLPHEDFRELVKAQDLVAVVPCSCRYRTASVGEPCDYTTETDRWNCIQFNRGADYAIQRGSGKKLSPDEARELIDRVEEDGLLHIWTNSDVMKGVGVSCQCCRDCCMDSIPMDMVGASIGKIWEKSRFVAEVDQEKCNGCQDCLDRCQFDAIEMIRVQTATTGKGKKGKLKSFIDPEKCWGCGVCVLACDETEALSMKAVRPPEFIPHFEAKE